MAQNRFEGTLRPEDKQQLELLAKQCRGDILAMTTLAASGHPGGSMSTIDMLLTVYQFANINRDTYMDDNRDRIVVSHGHISPAVYSTLGRRGFFPVDDAVSTFRLAGSIYEGHIERMVPGVEWTTGNLGQGLSAACGMAMSGRIMKNDFSLYVFMGDGEQQKGQISEARRFAVKYGLSNITAFIDYNRLQISGDISSVMPQNLRGEYEADGWVVLDVDGHDFDALYAAIGKAKTIDRPVMILAHTVMGKGVSFMENKHHYHGSPLSADQYAEAMQELGLENRLEELKVKRGQFEYDETEHCVPVYDLNVPTGTPRTYTSSTDNRSAFGTALTDIAGLIAATPGATPLAVFDCDLASSVKTGQIAKDFPEMFIQTGIQEHHAAVAAGALSANGVVTFFADFGAFGVDETYNQQRLNDINGANLKIAVTHLGIDVGEDGKTHQCIDYLGAMRNLFEFLVIIPADPNQTDRAVRYAAKTWGNFLIGMGRSKLPILSGAEGKPLFGEDYEFEYGKIDVLRPGKYALLTYGGMAYRALEIADILSKQGIELAVLNTATPLDLDEEVIAQYAEEGLIFTYEDHNAWTGLGSVVSCVVAQNGMGAKVVPFGVTGYAYSGNPDAVFKLLELSPAQVAEQIAAIVKG